MRYLFITFLFSSFLSCQQQSPSENATNELGTTQEKSAPLYDYSIADRLTKMGIELPELGVPVANYVHAVRTGNLVFLAGKGPRDAERRLITGKVGIDISIEEGYAAARLAGIEQLAALKGEIGDLNQVVRIVKVHGMVNAGTEFMEHSAVMNGFSDLMVEVFGERGKHARAAVGMGSLPKYMTVEVEMVVEVR